MGPECFENLRVVAKHGNLEMKVGTADRVIMSGNQQCLAVRNAKLIDSQVIRNRVFSLESIEA